MHEGLASPSIMMATQMVPKKPSLCSQRSLSVSTVHSHALYTPTHCLLKSAVHSHALYSQTLLEGPTRQVCREVCSVCTHSATPAVSMRPAVPLAKVLNPTARVRDAKSIVLQS